AAPAASARPASDRPGVFADQYPPPPPPLARSQKFMRHIPPVRSHSCCADMTGAVAMSAQPDATAIRTKRTKPVDTVLAIGASAGETPGTPAWVPEPDQRLSRRAP